MASGYAFGYMLAVPVLTTLTDRIDARHRAARAARSSAGSRPLAFGLFAQGFWSGDGDLVARGTWLCRRLHAGAEGADRPAAGRRHLASVTLYTSSFSVGVGLSFLVAQLVADRWGWRTAFCVTGFGPIAMVVACLLMPGQPARAEAGRLLNFAPVFATARRSATSSAMARTASSSTASAPGSSGSGPSSSRIKARRRG